MKQLIYFSFIFFLFCCAREQKKKESDILFNSSKEVTSNVTSDLIDTTKYSLKIYINNRRYEVSTIINIENRNIGKYDIITNAFIEPNDDNKIDFEKLKNRIIQLFPEEDKEVLVLIDWERRAWSELKREQGSTRFDKSVIEYVRVIEYIKSIRPNFKVGIFGLPFRMNKNIQQSKINDGSNKFDEIFKCVDFIAPSLYLEQLDKNSLSKKNKDIIINTLDESFKYSNRLQKPVIPFVWYRIHPNNKKDGLKVLPIQVMEQYLAEIAHYSKEGKGVSGVIWWESSQDKTTNDEEKFLNILNDKTNNKKISPKRDHILIEYSRIFDKN